MQDILAVRKFSTINYRSQGGTQGEGGLQPSSPPLQISQNRNLKKNKDFVDIIVSKVLRDLPFSQNQPLKSADD